MKHLDDVFLLIDLLLRLNIVAHMTVPCFAESLSFLDIPDNFLAEIPEQAFHNTPSLARVDLRNNLITHVPTNAFRQVCNGRHYDFCNINLPGNQISDIGPDAFPPAVDVLLLNRNRLKNASHTWLRNLTHLHILSLAENRIYDVVSNAFVDLASAADEKSAIDDLQDVEWMGRGITVRQAEPRR